VIASIILIVTMLMDKPRKYPNDVSAFSFKDPNKLDLCKIRIPIPALNSAGIKTPIIIIRSKVSSTLITTK
jgi:hypothetical protein